MTRDEWNGLPPSIALAALYDLVPGLARTEPPPVPKPPRYDGRLSRKGGTYCWMSEMNLESLKYWRKLKSESSDPQYAEKDAKTVRALDGFIAWRTVFPYETWSGTRGDDRATARPPSREPALHEWNNSGGSRRSRQDEPPSSPSEEPMSEEEMKDLF